MRVEISSAALQQIRAAAAVDPDREACGMLFGANHRIDAAEPCANVAPEPATTFEVDPAALLAAHRAMRSGGPRLVGYYHSHPNGCAEPSARDAVAAPPDGMVWIIVAGETVRAWRAVEAGPIAGRFAPLGLDLADAGCAGPSPSPEGTQI